MSSMKRQEMQAILDFINVYRANECLWKVKSKDYSNIEKKNLAMQALLELYQNFEHEATMDHVKKKILCLKAAFRREHKKVLDSKKSGCEAEDIYTPSLYYYNEMLFLQDQDIARTSTSTMESHVGSEAGTSNSLGLEPSEFSTPIEENTDYDASIVSDSNSTLLRPNPQRRRKRNNSNSSKTDEILNLVAKSLQSEPNNSNEAFGQFVGRKLNEFNPQTSRYARRLIYQVLDEGDADNLETASILINEEGSQFATNNQQPFPHMLMET